MKHPTTVQRVRHDRMMRTLQLVRDYPGSPIAGLVKLSHGDLHIRERLGTLFKRGFLSASWAGVPVTHHITATGRAALNGWAPAGRRAA